MKKSADNASSGLVRSAPEVGSPETPLYGPFDSINQRIEIPQSKPPSPQYRPIIEGSSLSTAKISKALARAQGMIEVAKKDADNPYFKSKYADLVAIDKVSRKHLSECGIAVVHVPKSSEDGLKLYSTLFFEDEWICGSLPLMCNRANNMQDLGSAITYARRYGLQSLVGIVAEGEDDDGNAAARPESNSRPVKHPDAANEAKAKKKVTQNQMKLLYVQMKKQHWTDDHVKAFINKKFGIESKTELTMAQFDTLLEAIASKQGPQESQPAPETMGDDRPY